MEFKNLIDRCQRRKCEEQIVEVKSANKGCPEKLYDTYSSFSNQSDGGTILFGLDEKANFQKVGVYDAQDLQKKLMEVGESMTPVVRPVLSVYEEDSMVFVAAEIPPVDLAERPCFKTSKGRLKGSYIRVGDADKPMTEYEIYSFEAFRKKYRDDIRPVENISLKALDPLKLEEYILKRKQGRPRFAELSIEQIYELIGITQNESITLAAVMLFSPYPQAYYPQLSIIASRVPGKEMGDITAEGQRFMDTQRIEGNIPEMLDDTMGFFQKNMRTSVHIDPKSGKRTDTLEYPMDALREAVLNALVHRDYSIHTENMPIQITMFSDRVEIRNPGGLYGRMTIDQLGHVQPDTRNPFLVVAMEALGQTENRYSGIPRIRKAMETFGLPEPHFSDVRGEFSVCLYNGTETGKPTIPTLDVQFSTELDPRGILDFCRTPRTRKEIVEFLKMASQTYAMQTYVDPLIREELIILSVPDHPKSPKQTYQTNLELLGEEK